MPSLRSEDPVTSIQAASPEQALAHFRGLLHYETDCWEVHDGIVHGDAGFVVLDVRSPALHARRCGWPGSGGR